MNSILASAVLAITSSLSSAPQSLPGVSDEETTISSPVTDFETGKGDVLFVRDRTNRWYRVQLNEGCSRGAGAVDSVAFEPSVPTSRIDRFSRVHFLRDGRTCAIESIRRSAAPPQKDSRSPVTLD